MVINFLLRNVLFVILTRSEKSFSDGGDCFFLLGKDLENLISLGKVESLCS